MNSMNISMINTLYSQKQSIGFRAENKQINSKTMYPVKYTLTDVEKEYGEVLQQLHTLESNINVQRQNLKSYYSAQDRLDYRKMLKERQLLLAKLRRIARRAGMQAHKLEYDVMAKKEYNRYAPKVFRAKTVEELAGIKELISSSRLFNAVREALMSLIAQKKF